MRRSTALRLLFVASLCCGAAVASAQTSFVAFESGPVRPLALSPDGSTLYATNIPDNTLEIFSVGVAGLTHTGSVPVGMEPVAVAVRDNGGNDEVWVVNHLSDSISIVDTSGAVPFVTRTLLVGDEPRDIVFAGTGGNRAFISTAHRGQQRTDASISGVTGAGDPQLTTPGIGRADVWVFDATSLGTTFGGTPVEILSFFADTPRALATDGSTVYVAAFHSGNQTTVINETLVPNGFDAAGPSGGAPGGVPGPDDNFAGDPAPETGVIVKFDGAAWRDVLGRDWSALVPFDLPDHDVFSIDADTLAPGSVVEYDSIGTILFNMVVNPSNGKVYVTNTELPNEVRFEGPGDHGGTTVQGHLSESRITVIDPAGPTILRQHLNRHIDYSLLHTDPAANHAVIDAQAAHSLATPLQPVVSSDGNTIYVAAFGSAKIGVFTKAELEDPGFDPNFDPEVQSSDYLDTSGGGPSGLALDETHDRLYVLTRFNNAVEVIELGSGTTSASHTLHNPEPDEIVDGRPFLYDAQISSGNGETSCASCHIFGDMDDLAWNLGDPDGVVTINNQPSSSVLPPAPTFHPMKGPMTTQTLRGLATHGGMHWRGDRVDGFFGTDSCTEPTGAPCNEFLSFRNFIVAFEGLLGKHGTISSFEMTQFTNFVLELLPPPNPIRNLDNSLTGDQAQGLSVFTGAVTDTVENCEGCHTLDPAQGFFSSGGEQSFEGEPQNAKVPHMRNMYAKLGMFSVAGDQIRGFGFLHDGSVDTIKTFVEAPVFSTNNAQELDLEEFSHVFPTDVAPIVGQQITIGPGNFSDTDTNDRIDLLIARCNTAFTSLTLGGSVTECDLVAKTVEGGVPKGYERLANGTFLPDDNGAAISEVTLRNKANPGGDAQSITYTAAPPGSGTRMGVDRDEDLLLDGVETNTGTFVNANDTGTDPANSDSDGDGIPDGQEVANGTDPTDPLDPPPPVVPVLPLAGGALLAIGLLAGWRDRRSLRR
jgi:sugar lactone lactonase YvrE